MKSRHCGFRLVNVLFSDEFASRLDEVNSPPPRLELDAGSTNGQSALWRAVAEAFALARSEYGGLIVDHPDFYGVDPAQIVEHSSDKLRSIWLDQISVYQRALTKSTRLGTHTSDFAAFCWGRVDILCLQHWLLLKPGLFSSVRKTLPDGIAYDAASRQKPTPVNTPA